MFFITCCFHYYTIIFSLCFLFVSCIGEIMNCCLRKLVHMSYGRVSESVCEWISLSTSVCKYLVDIYG